MTSHFCIISAQCHVILLPATKMAGRQASNQHSHTVAAPAQGNHRHNLRLLIPIASGPHGLAVRPVDTEQCWGTASPLSCSSPAALSPLGLPCNTHLHNTAHKLLPYGGARTVLKAPTRGPTFSCAAHQGGRSGWAPSWPHGLANTQVYCFTRA